MENSETFSIKEKLNFFKKKWIKENIFFIIVEYIFLSGACIGLWFLCKLNFTISIPIETMLFYIFKYNSMMKYVEHKVFDEN